MKKKYIYIFIKRLNVQADPNYTSLQQILVTFVDKSEFKVIVIR